MADIISPPANPVAPTKEQKVAARAAIVANSAQAIADAIVRLRERGFRAAWDESDPDVSPADIFAALGDTGLMACKRDADLAEFCVAQFPTVPLSPVPAGWTLSYDPATGIATATKTA